MLKQRTESFIRLCAGAEDVHFSETHNHALENIKKKDILLFVVLT